MFQSVRCLVSIKTCDLQIDNDFESIIKNFESIIKNFSDILSLTKNANSKAVPSVLFGTLLCTFLEIWDEEVYNEDPGSKTRDPGSEYETQDPETQDQGPETPGPTTQDLRRGTTGPII